MTAMATPCKWKINKKISALSDTSDQMDMVNIYKVFYFRKPEYTFFSSTHGNSQG